jgi:hypothetical protein
MITTSAAPTPAVQWTASRQLCTPLDMRLLISGEPHGEHTAGQPAAAGAAGAGTLSAPASD